MRLRRISGLGLRVRADNGNLCVQDIAALDLLPAPRRALLAAIRCARAATQAQHQNSRPSQPLDLGATATAAGPSPAAAAHGGGGVGREECVVCLEREREAAVQVCSRPPGLCWACLLACCASRFVIHCSHYERSRAC